MNVKTENQNSLKTLVEMQLTLNRITSGLMEMGYGPTADNAYPNAFLYNILEIAGLDPEKEYDNLHSLFAAHSAANGSSQLLVDLLTSRT